MRKSSRKREPIPQHFKSVSEAAEFWDTHDLADYWDLTREAKFDVDLQRRVFLTALEPELDEKAARLCSKARSVNGNADQRVAGREIDDDFKKRMTSAWSRVLQSA
jgi:hypothetical protein